MQHGRSLRGRDRHNIISGLKSAARLVLDQGLRFLPVLPVALIVGCIAYYGVDVPFMDDWGFTPVVTQAANDQLELRELFRQHNEHRMFVPKIIVALITSIWHWDQRVQMYLSVVLCSLTACNFAWLVRNTLFVSQRAGYALILLITALLFSIVQYENWLWGFQFAFFIPPLCLSGSWVVLLSRLRIGVKFGLCATLAAIGMFSFPTGAFAWALSFPLFVVTATEIDRRAILRWLGCWLIAAASCTGLFLLGYHEPPHSARILSGFHPLAYIEYALVFLGGNMFRDLSRHSTTVALLLGLCLVVLYLSLVVYLFADKRSHGLKQRSLPWIAFGAFAFASAALCAFGRRPYFTAQQALESRYTTFSLALVVSLVGLLVLVLRELHARAPRSITKVIPWLIGAGLVLLVLGHALSWSLAFEQMGYSRTYHLDGKAALQFSRVLRHPEVAEATITATLYPDISAVRMFTKMLHEADQIRPAFAHDARMDNDNPKAPNKKRFYGRFESMAVADGQYVASGWAVLPDRRERADGVVLAFRNTEGVWSALTMAAERKERPDLRKHRRDRSMKQAGWTARIPKEVMPPEARELSAWAVDATTGKTYRLAGTHPLG